MYSLTIWEAIDQSHLCVSFNNNDTSVETFASLNKQISTGMRKVREYAKHMSLNFPNFIIYIQRLKQDRTIRNDIPAFPLNA